MKIQMILIGILLLLLAGCNQVKREELRSILEGRGVEKVLALDNEITGKRYALVIGNAAYSGDPNIKPLRNPVNDARDMRDILKTVGFDDVNIIYSENVPNKREMVSLVNRFTQKLQSGGVGLFYYAGHGIQADGENYLIPTTVSLPTQVELEYEAMSANFVLDKMKYAQNDLNIIILDACRNNPLPTRGRSVAKRGLAEMRNPTGSLVIFSTAPGTSASDGVEDNGLFTKHLLMGIKKHSSVPIGEMLMFVRNAVMKETNDEQVPWENGSLTRKFCFSGCTNPEEEKARRLAEELEALKRENDRRPTEDVPSVNEAARQIEALKQQAEKDKKKIEGLKAEKLIPSEKPPSAGFSFF